MRYLMVVGVVAVGFCGAALAAASYTLDSDHNFSPFEIKHLGFLTHHGPFNKTKGKLFLDRAAGTGSVDIMVDTASISTGDPALEKHLRAEDFFNVAKFPVMTFRSKTFKFNGDMPVAAEGELTLLGVTRPLTLSISRVKCGPHPVLKKEECGAEVSGTLKRSEFGMKAYVPLVGDEVTLHIQVEAYKD